REPEVEHARRDPLAVHEEDVRRLDVPMQDPGRVSVSEAFADLRARLDRGVLGHVAVAKHLTERAPWDELVRDVDVPRVAPEGVCAETRGMAQLCGGLRLTLGPRSRLALARDDLERDVESRLLVAREPDRAGASATQRAQGPVAVED